MASGEGKSALNCKEPMIEEHMEELVEDPRSSIDVAATRRRRHSSYVSQKDENQVRGNWTGKLDFIFSCMSFAIGLGNVWRFPYKCYQNGGGAFLIPFCVMLVLAGLPMLFLETAFGQYASAGVISVWKVAPIFTGIGYSMFLISFSVSVYYNVIVAWTFFYLFSSFSKVLPWQHCGHWWNTDACRERVYGAHLQLQKNCTSLGGVLVNSTCHTMNNTSLELYNVLTQNMSRNATSANETEAKSPSDEFFHNAVLGISSGLEVMGPVRWQLALCLLLTWTIVCVCLIKGIKSSGKAVYVTSTFPYLVLLILLIRGVTLPGSVNGILYYLTPRWEKLLSPQVWGEAAIQIFFNLAPGWGPLIVLSSYNKFKNNCLRDAYIVSIGAALTSIFAGFVIFSIIGYMAFQLDKPVDKVLDEGPGLAFIVYPEVVTRLPLSPFWAILFFLMFITLGIGTEFGLINAIHTTIIDMFPKVLHKGWRPSYLMIAICVVEFLLGLSMCTEGGMYLLILFDAYAPTYTVLVVAIVECIALAWVYGYSQLQADIKLMLGFKLSIFWRAMWQFICPITLTGVLVFMLATFKPNRYRGYEFPLWSELLGWAVTGLIILVIPAVAVYKVTQNYTHLSLGQRLLRLCRPDEDWGPALFRNEPGEIVVSVDDDNDVFHPLNNTTTLSNTTTLNYTTTLYNIKEEPSKEKGESLTAY